LDEAAERGRMEGKVEVVNRLLAMGYSVKEITAITGVTVGFVNKVKASLKAK
jgi:transposase